MQLTIVAMGRLRSGPEKTLIDDYLDRAGKTGRAFGLGPARVIEVDDRKTPDKPSQAAALRRAVPEGAVLVAMDERGKRLSSPDFADRLDAGRATVSRYRDCGRHALSPSVTGT